jgi:mono/diheme cytochrome c family protein
MGTRALGVGAVLVIAVLGWTQAGKTGGSGASPYSPLPVSEVRRPNPVKPTPESIAEGKKIYSYDCAGCHGANGDGKTDAGKEMKIPDFTDPEALKDHTDGQMFYVIKNGRGSMPLEGDRVKEEQMWDLVNYVRSLAKKKAVSAESKPSG